MTSRILESELGNIKEGEIFQCVFCNKEMRFGEEGFHFMGEPTLIINGNITPDEDIELFATCEKCHNKIWGKDKT